MRRPRALPHSRLTLVVLALGAFVLLLGLTELGARSIWAAPGQPYVWPPFMEREFRPLPEVLPGVEGVSRFRISSVGLRSDEPAPEDAYRILSIGGSTTECLYLDQEEAWPALVQAQLRAATGQRVWVANAGRSGNTTREHVLQVEHLVRAEPHPDAILLTAGVNDLVKRLSQNQDYDPQYMQQPGARESLRRSAFSVLPSELESGLPFYKRTSLWRLASRLNPLPDPREQKTTGKIYADWRTKRHGASALINELPDLSSALAEFRANLTACVETAQAAGVRVILIDQPGLWSADLPPELEQLLWLGGIGDFTSLDQTEYYTAGALAEGLARYNQAVHEVARTLGVESIALSEQLTSDGSVFYDDVHFTEEGARQVSALLSAYLTSHAPFADKTAR